MPFFKKIYGFADCMSFQNQLSSELEDPHNWASVLDCYEFSTTEATCKYVTTISWLWKFSLHREKIVNWHKEQQSLAQSEQCKIPSDGTPIGRWRCSWEFFGTHWSNKSDAQPSEGDYIKFVLICLNIEANRLSARLAPSLAGTLHYITVGMLFCCSAFLLCYVV